MGKKWNPYHKTLKYYLPSKANTLPTAINISIYSIIPNNNVSIFFLQKYDFFYSRFRFLVNHNANNDVGLKMALGNVRANKCYIIIIVIEILSTPSFLTAPNRLKVN